MAQHAEQDSYREFPADPDPVAVLTLCFGGVSMVAAVGNLIINIRNSRRQRSEDIRNERVHAADFLVMADRLSTIGRRLNRAIAALSRDSGVALSFLPTGGPFQEERGRALTGRTIRPGENLVQVEGASREMWELLIDDVCGNVKLINTSVLDYTELMPQLIEELRRTGSRFDIPVEALIERVDRRAHLLQSKAEVFQRLGPKASLAKAERAFQDLCDEAQRFMYTIDDVVNRMRRELG